MRWITLIAFTRGVRVLVDRESRIEASSNVRGRSVWEKVLGKWIKVGPPWNSTWRNVQTGRSNPAYAGKDMLEGESIRARPTEVLWIAPLMYLNNLPGCKAANCDLGHLIFPASVTACVT